jgi:hypothetical protein
MGARAVVLSYFGILLLVVATHLAGLWTYPAESSSREQAKTSGSSTKKGDASKTNNPEDSRDSSNTALKESTPIVTQGGFTIIPGCALWTVDGYELYYSPVDPTTICVQPPSRPFQAGSTPPTSRTAQVPPNCAFAPDSTLYCFVGGQLTTALITGLYDQGKLQTPKEETKGGGDNP